MMTLDEIIDNKTSDTRELKRALVVKMDECGIARKEISKLLNVLTSYISRWCIHYHANDKDASSLLLNYKGSRSYLTEEEKAAIVIYLESQKSITLLCFKSYILEKYGVKYKSDQSYYELLKLGKWSWKRTQKKIQERMN